MGVASVSDLTLAVSRRISVSTENAHTRRISGLVTGQALILAPVCCCICMCMCSVGLVLEAHATLKILDLALGLLRISERRLIKNCPLKSCDPGKRRNRALRVKPPDKDRNRPLGVKTPDKDEVSDGKLEKLFYSPLFGRVIQARPKREMSLPLALRAWSCYLLSPLALTQTDFLVGVVHFLPDISGRRATPGHRTTLQDSARRVRIT
ncbi:hypothetical protein RRG08_035892 [Elysia crispata]|uniref:Uncharacterized protein n=1 Tax=Elysia crispata TaxID=231223 RepID=A0AAE1A1N1_9GAST|nr:hypothetical protein RRG08_035892 [Elysia crispata]